MAHITGSQMATLVDLAKVNQEKDDLSVHLGDTSYVPEELKQMFQEVEADSKKEAMRNAVDSIRQILSFATEAKKQSVQNIRSIRLTEKMELAQLANIDRALQYGAETMNYVPLAATLGLPLPASLVSPADTLVPSNWKPKAAPKKAGSK